MALFGATRRRRGCLSGTRAVRDRSGNHFQIRQPYHHGMRKSCLLFILDEGMKRWLVLA
jgi:hypothetical protein